MGDKNLLDPRYNDLIPGGPMPEPPELSPDYAELHPPEPPELSPDYEALHPSGPPNDLCPGYVEPPKRAKVEVKTPDLMSFLTKAAGGGGHGCERERVELAPGLTGSFCPSGGLSVFKNGVQVVDRMELSVEDRAAMNDFLDRERNK